MRIPLKAVGSKPPKSARGKTFLPEGFIDARVIWGHRAFWGLVALVLTPWAVVVGAWWYWGLRKRMWRWYAGVAGVASAVLVGAASPQSLLAGVDGWRMFMGRTFFNSFTIPGSTPTVPWWEAVPWLDLALGGWVFGTIAACQVSWLAWYRTPPWKDRARPKTFLQKRRERRLVEALREGRGDTPGKITFGIDTDTGKAVELPWRETEGHMLVLGAPGTGKTTSAMKVVRASIRDGMFTGIVDMKAQRDLIEQVSDWCARWDRPLWVFSEHGPTRYDPFRHGNWTSRADLMLATSAWTEEHYRRASLNYLRTMFYLMELMPERANAEGHFTMATRLLNPNLLLNELKFLPKNNPHAEEARVRVAALMDQLGKDDRAVAGLGPRVLSLQQSVLGQWTEHDPAAPFIDLQSIWDDPRGGVVIFSLPTLAYEEAACAFGGLVVQDFKTLAGRLQERGNTRPGLVFIDEFSHAGVHNVIPALAMARSSKLRWMLATQDLGDLRKGGGDTLAFEQAVLTDTNIKLLHGVSDPDTAEKLSRMAGMKWGVKERTGINQSDSTIDITAGTQAGHGFVEDALVPIVEPTDLMHQGAMGDSRFVLMSKPGEWLVSGAHTVPDLSVVTDDMRERTTAEQYLPVPGTVVVPKHAVNVEQQRVEATPPPPKTTINAGAMVDDMEGDPEPPAEEPPVTAPAGGGVDGLHPFTVSRLNELSPQQQEAYLRAFAGRGTTPPPTAPVPTPAAPPAPAAVMPPAPAPTPAPVVTPPAPVRRERPVKFDLSAPLMPTTPPTPSTPPPGESWWSD